MLWLYNQNQNYNNNFFQIFVENNKIFENENNHIWSLEATKNDNIFELEKNNNK